MDMREYISQRLDGMRSVTEKNMLRDVMEDIFIPMYDHVEAQYAQLERRVKDEMPLSTNLYGIWTTLLERDKANGSCLYLFPMLEDDISRPAIEIADLQNRMKSEREIRLDTVLIQADYLACKEISDSNEIFTGTIMIGNDDYRVGIRLRPAKRYQGCIENLYKLFLTNSVPWQTINSPYLFKMFDVMLMRIDLNGKEATGVISDYKVAYGKWANNIKQGLVPVWNIQKLRIKSEDFPLAALDKVNYEYQFDLEADGLDSGYLADYGSADISAMRREENSLIITSPLPKGIVWDMYKVVKRKNFATDYFQCELMNNMQDDSFAARMIAHYATVIKTNAELNRVLNSYEVSACLELDSIQVVTGKMTGETYEVNTFLKDEVRDLAISKTLMMKFKPLKRNYYLIRDIMSFLVSQVQLIYPEFHCTGVLL